MVAYGKINSRLSPVALRPTSTAADIDVIRTRCPSSDLSFGCLSDFAILCSWFSLGAMQKQSGTFAMYCIMIIVVVSFVGYKLCPGWNCGGLGPWG